MSDHPVENKPMRAQRREALAARRRMSGENRWQASLRIAEQVCRAPFFRRNRIVGCYLPLHDEVDTWPIIARAWRMKKRIFVPIIAQSGEMLFRELSAESDLSRNRFGIEEPVCGDLFAPGRLGIVLTPVVAFDAENHRIGMGGGYYDRVFSFLRGRRAYCNPRLIGLAFACQKVEKISPNPWDIRVFQTICETDGP